ncbi:MAG: 2Fe-2S iron-sulfur cluster-binding protein [Pseudomonadota bacterium]
MRRAGPARVTIVHPSGREEAFNVPEDARSILDAGLDAGVAMPYSCCAGICTSCRAQVLAGRADPGEQDVLTPEELQSGFILCCQALPLSDTVRLRFAP